MSIFGGMIGIMWAPVTIVIVAFNHAAYVRECLESALQQTLRPERIVIIDDRSQDRTVSVVADLIADLPQSPTTVELRVHSENVGLCRSLNEALADVSTEYMAYISADDVMEPERLETQLPVIALAGERCAAVYSDAYRMSAGGCYPNCSATRMSGRRAPRGREISTSSSSAEATGYPRPRY